jgi:hypothetical protein
VVRISAARRQRFRNRVFNALMQAKEGALGQPLKVERFRTVAELAEELVEQGVPFGTCRNSRMNKEICRRLNEEVRKRVAETTRPTTSLGKSDRMLIKGGAVERWLKKVTALRSISDHFIAMGLYGD